MINISLEEVKVIPKLRKVKNYKSKSKAELIIIPKPEMSIEKIGKKLINQAKNKRH